MAPLNPLPRALRAPALTGTWSLRLFALRKIPLIALLRPRVLELGPDRCRVSIPLSWVARNHLGGMYFGALCVGADLAAGLPVMAMITGRRAPVAFLFKDLQAEFLKRAEGAVVFVCEEVRELGELLQRTQESQDRQERTVTVTALVPDKLQQEPVARFRLTISMKRR